MRRLAPRLVVDAPAAFFTALVFALHPAQTEAVTYVSGRSTALMAAFSLLAALAHLRANEAGARRRAGDRVAVVAWRAFSGLAFLCDRRTSPARVTLALARPFRMPRLGMQVAGGADQTSGLPLSAVMNVGYAGYPW